MSCVSKVFIAFCLINVEAHSAIAAECSVKSGAQTLPLLELYTSEGCSSCPPADKWLSGLKSKNVAVTPLAFHVDYWDYIGWKDIYAKPEFSDRQRKLAALNFSGFVYTPQFTLNGQDVRNVTGQRFDQALESIAKEPARAELILQLTQSASGEMMLHAQAKPVKPTPANNPQVFIAIYQNQLVSKVQAGENAGRALEHDFVVREFLGGYSLNNAFSKKIPIKSAWKAPSAGAVLFVQDATTGEVWQTLRLPFCS